MERRSERENPLTTLKYPGMENKEDSWTPKDKQNPRLREFTEYMYGLYKDTKPTKTIGNHHYVRQRNLERFLYDFGVSLLVRADLHDVINPAKKD